MNLSSPPSSTARIADLSISAQIFDARLIENIRADLTTPADVGFRFPLRLALLLCA